MNTMIKSSNGISLVPIESRLLADRKLFIEGKIDTKLACDFEKCAMLLLKEDAEKPINGNYYKNNSTFLINIFMEETTMIKLNETVQIAPKSTPTTKNRTNNA